VPPLPEADDRCDPAEARACVGSDVFACDAGTLGRRLQACHEGCSHGVCDASCTADGVKLIYVVDTNNNFLSFDPRKLPSDPFHRIGKLACGTDWSRPFSMAVDRGGVAWVVYDDGELFKVSITDAKCTPSGYVAGGNGLRTFGMGFVTDASGGKSETLFIAERGGDHDLATIDTRATPPTSRRIHAIEAGTENNPELTGTSEAKLFGFYPRDADPSFVQEIDRASGAARGPRWTLGTSSLGFVSAYAFAQWAGTFYIFITTGDGSSVRAIDPKTGLSRTVMDQIPYRITGAGVSTCAPERDSGGP